MSNRQPSKALFQFAAYVPTLTGTLSSIGSVAIISHIFVYRNVKLRNPHFRILLGLSVYDLLYSANKALLFLTHPKVQGILGAQGNSTTCALQGFFTHLGYAANCYSAFLGSFFYLTICHGVKSRTFAQRLEPILHVAITVLFMTLASYSVSIGLYNPTGAFCFIAPWPPRCNGNPDVDCERFGDTHSLYYEFFAQLWLQIAYVVVLFTNDKIWYTVRQQEKRVAKYEFSRQLSGRTLAKVKSSNKHTRQVAIQSFLYVAAFFLGVSFTTVYHLIGWIGGYSAFWPLPIINTLAPLQGFWNAFIYARPRYLRIRERARRSNAPPLGFWLTLRMVFFPTTVPEEVVEQSTASAISSSVCLDLLDEAGPRRKNVEECLPGNIGVSDPDEGGREGIDAMNSRSINTAINPGGKMTTISQTRRLTR